MQNFKTIMSEDFIHFLWNYSYYDSNNLISTSGEKIEVIKHGEHNHNAGPDFFNAKIKIGETIWVGNIEIHINSSDWNKHKHSDDAAYNNVILHVVLNHDTDIKRANGETITTLQIKYNTNFESRYNQLMKNKQWVACQNYLPGLNKFDIHFWLAKIAIERLNSKSQLILESLERNKNNWEESFYHKLARSFGLNINSEAFEQLALSLPLLILAKHKNNLIQLEALLFGQAGMLDDTIPDDEYFNQLKKEYLFLKKKYKLKPIEAQQWKFLRLRPSNFPTIRISQFANLVYKSTALFSKSLEAQDIKTLQKFYQVSASDYWNNHYVFGKTSRQMKKQLGQISLSVIFINTVIPFIFVFGQIKGIEQYKNKAVDLLEEMKAENNSIVSRWAKFGIKADNALYSQALIQLKKEYCDKKKCLKCKIGNEIIISK